MGMTTPPQRLSQPQQPGTPIIYVTLLIIFTILGIVLLPASPSQTTLRQAHDEIVKFPDIPLRDTVNFGSPEIPPEIPTAPEPDPEPVIYAPLGQVTGPPSINADRVQTVLDAYNSPARHTPAQVWIDLGVAYGIDPAYALAFFIHESSAGTNGRWDGMLEMNHDDVSKSVTTHNIGNIQCAGFHRCAGRWRHYDSWEEGIEDWYRLIKDEYVEWRGADTVKAIIPIYAPSFENNVQGYIDVVHTLVQEWRDADGVIALTACAPDNPAPCGNPLGTGNNIVMTQDYGVGSHAPANIWGAIDLALDSNGDGHADPDGTWGQPIYATHSGVVTVTRNSWPAGNHVWVMNDQYKTGYAHLHDFAVADGTTVERGHQLGTIGSTGQSSGPHLDYQVWQMNNGEWVNVNPLDY